ncbi:hypothetical protein AHiyo4_31270 [Arthrobacter sp. Hiyo4]|nr:hypothetical protein AHiyo4_31270 [Arthrobacter sp. Hiyo4]
MGSTTFTLYEVGTLKTVRVDARPTRTVRRTLRIRAAMCQWTAA